MYRTLVYSLKQVPGGTASVVLRVQAGQRTTVNAETLTSAVLRMFARTDLAKSLFAVLSFPPRPARNLRVRLIW